MEMRRWVFVVLVYPCLPATFATADPATNAPSIFPAVTVVGHSSPSSLTSPSLPQAAGENTAIPVGFTIKSSAQTYEGRASNFEDLLKGTPGLPPQSEDEVEVSKISMRGSGIDSADEPLGVEFMLDGMSFQ